jgi:subtilisin family serine protease
VHIENILRWFNAVTAYLTPEQCRSIRFLPFVKRIVPVAAVRRAPDEPSTPVPSPVSRPLQKNTIIDYGLSRAQLQAVNIIAVHQRGISGDSAIIGMLDTGFRWKTNDALRNTKVIGEYDFIFKDSVTANQTGDDPIQDSHGTNTLSIIAATLNGTFIGAATGASFILAKTEDMRSEHKVEEDNWAAAIEWMERLGADVVSSSLGYSTFDSPDQSYTWSHGDFNGRTTITAQAAIIAARKGVLVVNAMGNAGNGNGIVGTLDTPADADSILAVGAVTYLSPDSGLLATFSSTGPTNDGRIKPDVVAPGVGTYVITTDGTPRSGNGTSFATPLVAGAAALIFSAHPELTAMEVRTALRATASRASSPDNFFGCGEINALAALAYFDSAVIPVPPPRHPDRFVIYQSYPNPFRVSLGGGTSIRFDVPEASQVSITVYSILGRKIRTLLAETRNPGAYSVEWDGRDGNGNDCSSGVYLAVFRTPRDTQASKIILLH